MASGYLRRLDPRLPRVVWLVQGGGVVNSLGNGMAFPFIIIYLHNVRGISFAAAGFSLAAGAVAALVAGLGAVGGVLGPAVGGPLLGWHPLAVWPTAAAVCVFAIAGCLLLERNLPPGVRRTPKRVAAPVTPLEPPLDLAPERL
jgi:hypothetical protein